MPSFRTTSAIHTGYALGDLYRTAGGGEQVQDHRDAAASDAWGVGETEHFLQPYGEDRHAVGGVVQGDLRAA